ncbi:MAG: hypothetical protein ACP5G0_01215 [Desulfomonilia bacterium]
MDTTEHLGPPAEASAKIVADIVRSPGTRYFLSSIAGELIRGWASGRRTRERIASGAQRIVSRVLIHPGGVSGRGISGPVGSLLTSWARKVNAEHASNPVYHAAGRSQAIEDFLKNTDFGEIREVAESSQGCFLKTVEIFNEHLWRYPAKVGSILATLLALVNTGIRSVRELLRPIEQKVGPDLLADLTLSLLKGIDAREAATLVNSMSELIRRLHTGNYLLAKAGKPLFQLYLTQQFQDALPNIDPVLLKKARIALSEDKEAMVHALADSLSENPGILIELVSAYGSVKTPAIRGLSRKVRLFEEVDGNALAEALAHGLSDLDTFEIAEVINGFLRLVNTLHDTRPEMLTTIVNSIADCVDPDQVKETARWFVPEIIDAARPVLEAVMPSLVRGLTDVLSPGEGMADEEHDQALQRLREVLLAAGGER